MTREESFKDNSLLPNVWAIAFGYIVGWGAFVNPGKRFLPNSAIYGTAIAMVLGSLLSLCFIELLFVPIS